MTSCYWCGKMILGRKVMGLLGDKMYAFCSDKCRSSAWVKNNEGRKASQQTDEISFSESSNKSSENTISNEVPRNARDGDPSKIIVDGAEYSYSAKTDGITIKIANLTNKSSWMTGALKLELFLSKSGKYKPGERLSGYCLALSSNYAPLRKNFGYTNLVSTCRKYESPKSGTYQPVLFIRELNANGDWKIASYVNFPTTVKWI